MDKNKCSSCGEAPHKCSCKNKEFTKAVIEINNPEQITLMRRVVIPASMGDDTTVPPVVGKYKNVLLYYEANKKSYLYSSDGIPTQLVNGLTNYEEAINLPQINDVTLSGNKSAADLKLADAPMIITINNSATRWSGADSVSDVYDFFKNRGEVNIVFAGGENYAYGLSSAGYIEEEGKLLCIVVAATTHTIGGVTDFDGGTLYGLITLYNQDKSVDVGQIDLQPKLFVTDFTGLSLNYDELSGVPATTYSIGMVKPGDGLEVDNDGILSVNLIDAQSDWSQSDSTKLNYIKNKPTIPLTNYSTSEIDTGAIWVDDSTIYKKTINFGALPNATTKSALHGISNLSRVVKIEGYAYDAQNVLFTQLGCSDMMVNATSTQVEVQTTTNWSDFTESYITVYYTKSS